MRRVGKNGKGNEFVNDVVLSMNKQDNKLGNNNNINNNKERNN